MAVTERRIVRDQPGIFRPAIVNAVSRNQEEEGHDRGIDDSDETIRVRFRGLDNTNTVSEMQLCINIRIVMWGRQFPFGQLAKYIYLVCTRGFSWILVGEDWENEKVSGMLACVTATNQPIVLRKPKCDDSYLRHQRNNCSLFSIIFIFLIRSSQRY